MYQRTISEVDHFNIVAKRAAAGTGTYAKPGEGQAKACKRLAASLKRAATAEHRLSSKFPAFKPGMSTAEYVRLYEASHASQSGLICRGFWGQLNDEPATLYEGGALDFAPVMESVPDDEVDSFDYAGSYSEHVAVSNAIGAAPMSYARWIRTNSGAPAQDEAPEIQPAALSLDYPQAADDAAQLVHEPAADPAPAPAAAAEAPASAPADEAPPPAPDSGDTQPAGDAAKPAQEAAEDPAPADVCPIDWQTLAARPTAVYATPVYRIGVHEWRTVVYVHETYGACTDHVWRRVDTNRGVFKRSNDWPKYDSDDTYSGLPLSIGPRIYSPHREEIQRTIDALRRGDAPSWAGAGVASAMQTSAAHAAARARMLAILAPVVAVTPAPDAAPAPAAPAPLDAAAAAPVPPAAVAAVDNTPPPPYGGNTQSGDAPAAALPGVQAPAPAAAADPKAVERIAARKAYIPPAFRGLAQRVSCKGGEAEAWTWTDDKGRPRAVAFWGRSEKPYSGRSGPGGCYWFRNEAARRDWLADMFKRARAHAERMASQKAERAAKLADGHKLEIGAILRASWGYEQTNIDYFEVTRKVGARMVEVRQISAESQDEGGMSGVCVPMPGRYVGEPMRRRVSGYDGASVAIDSSRHASLIEGRMVGGVRVFAPDRWTAYA